MPSGSIGITGLTTKADWQRREKKKMGKKKSVLSNQSGFKSPSTSRLHHQSKMLIDAGVEEESELQAEGFMMNHHL